MITKASVWGGAVDAGRMRQGFRVATGNDTFGFKVLLVYLCVEYGRPMDLIPFLGIIRPSLIVTGLLVWSWFACGKVNELFDGSRQVRLLWWLIGLMTLYIPFARNNTLAFKFTLSVVQYMPFVLSIILYINTVERARTFFQVWSVLAVYLAVMGVAFRGLAGGNFLADENDFSLLMNMMLPFPYFLFMYEKNLGRRVLYLSAAILCAISVVASFSRGGFVGLLVVGSVVWWFSPRKMLSLVLVAILGVGVLSFSDEKYWGEMGTIANTDEGTARERLDSWAAAWEMFKDNPWGVGAGNFPVHFSHYQPPTMKTNMWGRAAHSLWFTLLSELGVAGVCIYVMLAFRNIHDLLLVQRLVGGGDTDARYLGYVALACLASLAGFFASGTFISVLFYPHYFYFTGMIVAIRKNADRWGFQNGHDKQ